MYRFLDIFFIVFHTLWILFNLFGWIWDKTRFLNLITLLLTGGSWFILGIWYGIGYCPCTQWHWEARRELGYTEMPNSYTKFLVDTLTGLDVNAQLVDIATVLFFFIALGISVYLNIFKSS